MMTQKANQTITGGQKRRFALLLPAGYGERWHLRRIGTHNIITKYHQEASNTMVEKNESINDGKYWIALSEKALLRIFIYYCFILIAGLVGSVWAIYDNHCSGNKYDKIIIAIAGSLSMAAVGSAIFYTRKIYKASIQERITKPVDNNIRNFGTIIYFIIRPIFSLVLSILVVVGINAGMLSMTDQDLKLSEGFVNICMFISFFCGFSSGKMIQSLEKKGTHLITSLFQNTKGN
ncbi:MAG: hypothetical protein K8F34_16340 [Candidatus Kuenenia stuttgartiensis]|nr:hypothetical protein [Candidatus Kuenenia stuttgartiensis]